MKISAKKYARAFYEAVSESHTGEEVNSAARNLAVLLWQAGDLKKTGDILSHFSLLYDKERNVSELSLVTAAPLSADAAKNILTMLEKFLGVKKIIAKHELDQSIIGGFKAVGFDYVVDASVSSSLNRLKDAIIN